MKRGKKRLNAKLECHMAEPHAFPHEVFSYIYIYILVLCQCVAQLNKFFFDNIIKLNNK